VPQADRQAGRPQADLPSGAAGPKRALRTPRPDDLRRYRRSVSPSHWRRLPSPRRQYTTGVAAAVLFVVTTVMFVDEPSWLLGLAAGLMLLCTLTSFGLARSRAARGRLDRT
jgi:hypothetical protein